MWKSKNSKDCRNLRIPQIVEIYEFQRLWKSKKTKDCGNVRIPKIVETQEFLGFWTLKNSGDSEHSRIPGILDTPEFRGSWKSSVFLGFWRVRCQNCKRVVSGNPRERGQPRADGPDSLPYLCQNPSCQRHVWGIKWGN